MDRASIYFMNETDQNTYDYDEKLPPLPLPDLHDTLQRYYESLKPFGTPIELANTRAILDKFEHGIGDKLHKQLKTRAAHMKNWLDQWWDKYGYHCLRFPLNPYVVMAMPMKLEMINIPETPENFLKTLARLAYHSIEFWDLLHKAKIKPLSSNGGKLKYSSALYKRFYSTTRVPGVEVDHIDVHFKTAAEGKTPIHGLISGKGRLFIFNCVHDDGSLVTAEEMLVLLQRVRSILEYEPLGDCVPVLTHDDRTAWAHNRQSLLDISQFNRDNLKLVESSSIVIAFDEHEPKDYCEISQECIYGDYHSKWGDRTSTIIAFKNGKFACIGEHSAYDGTVSVSFALYMQLSLFEVPEPSWHNLEKSSIIELNEIKFELNNILRQEIQRVLEYCDKRGYDVIVKYTEYHDYGKEFMKDCSLHPDSFIQVIMQWAYAQMHQSIAPTYETALMRQYYNGRTETLRSCTTEVHKFIEIAMSPTATNIEIVKAFRAAVEQHNYMMNEARKGHGVDRHLFGLWCVAHEQNISIPELFDDPLYAKSGGGGNFILSTSTLGYSAIVGFVSPMVLDGYGIFYSITPQALFIITTAYRDSTKTSAHKFNEVFKDTFRRIKTLIDDTKGSKL